ncbi:MAG: TetR/AcrR family transcriptional regulator [Alphaproteobacteria bacterium]
MGIRERSKQKRRNRILITARGLIVDEGVAGLSMRALADGAEVSVATLYNLLGSKEEILYALLDQSYDTLDMSAAAVTEGDSIARAELIVSVAAKQFLSDADFYKRLLRGIQGIESGERASKSILKIWALAERVVADGMSDGLLRNSLPPRLIAQMILASYSGAMRNWVIGRIDNETFMAQVRLGLVMSLLSVATDETRPRLELRADELGTQVLQSHSLAGATATTRDDAVA